MARERQVNRLAMPLANPRRRDRAANARIHWLWLGAVFAVVLVEIVGGLSMVLGPSRFEYTASVGMLRLRRLIVPSELSAVSSGQLSPGVAPGSVLQIVINQVKTNDLVGAQAAFADDAVVHTHMGNVDMAPIQHSGLAFWLRNVAVSLQIDADQIDETPGGYVESALVETTQLQYVGITNARAVYTIVVRNGKITSVDVRFTPDSVERFNESFLMLAARYGYRASWGMAAILVAIVFPTVIFFIAMLRRHYLLAAMLLVGPLVILGDGGRQLLDDPNGSAFVRVIPSDLIYPTHALIGTTLNQLGVWPSAAALQWAKAASHSGSPSEAAQVAQGIAIAYHRSQNDRQLRETLCTIYNQDNLKVQAAISQAGVRCS